IHIFIVNTKFLVKGNKFVVQLNKIKKMNIIAVITTKYASNYPDVDFEALKQKEIPMVMKWKEEGIIENFFVRTDANGAML
ncbi:hypothetical protein B2I22_00135, partial [Bacillus spizizenii]